jgi:hypothetical protein
MAGMEKNRAQPRVVWRIGLLRFTDFTCDLFRLEFLLEVICEAAAYHPLSLSQSGNPIEFLQRAGKQILGTSAFSFIL